MLYSTGEYSISLNTRQLVTAYLRTFMDGREGLASSYINSLRFSFVISVHGDKAYSNPRKFASPDVSPQQ